MKQNLFPTPQAIGVSTCAHGHDLNSARPASRPLQSHAENKARGIWRSLCSFALSLLSLTGFARPVSAATLSVTPSACSNLYTGDLTFQITGLTNGETVLVERFLDLNTNGVIDGNDFMVQSFLLTDGQVTSIAGVRNGNIPGDNDLTANGQITATLSFANGPEFTRISSSQIFQLSSPKSRFPAVQQSITVTQAVYPHRITGKVLDLATPLPHAQVALVIPTAGNIEFISGTVADGSGNYSINASNGTYLVLGFFQGRTGATATGPFATVSGTDVVANIPLTGGSFTVSGFVTEYPSGLGAPAMQVFLTGTNGDYTALFTYPHGGISIPLTNNKWKFDTSDLGSMLAGLLRPQNKVKVVVAGTNVTGVTVPAYQETALIYGKVTDQLGNPLAGVILDAFDNSNLYSSRAVSDAAGNYFLATVGETWAITAASPVSGLPSGYTLQPAGVTLTDGQAVQLNLVASPPTFLAGHATDSLGAPITNGNMLAISASYMVSAALLAGDGSFAIPIPSAGAWGVTLEAQSAASRNVVAISIPFNVTSGVSISNINYVAPVSTRTISGWIKTATGIGVTNIIVFASATINGTNYGANLPTDKNGNYSLPVLPGVWSVGPDSQGLGAQGYATAYGQTIDTSSTNQIVDFLVGTPTTNTMVFRHDLGNVGQFGGSLTPTVTYPVAIQSYRAVFHAFSETNPPAPNTVFFTGPGASGLTNTPAEAAFGAMRSGTDVFYSSSAVRNPAIALGGGWSVLFRTNANNFNMPDPQAVPRTVVPLPTLSLSNGVLNSLSWAYYDSKGNPIGGIPSFVQSSRIDLLDQSGKVFDTEVFPAATAFTYPASSQYAWSSVGTLRMGFYDNLKNEYFVDFHAGSSTAIGTLTGATYGPGHQFQFLLNGPTGTNFTVQYSTNLGVAFWNTLLVTNSLTSPITILDPNASGPYRFYRALAGP
jgi:hypothetical protein